MAQCLMLSVLSTHSTHEQGYSSVQAQYWNNSSYVHSTCISFYLHMVAKAHTHCLKTIQRSYAREKQKQCCY